MDQYCVVVCGLQAGTSDDAAAWQPVAAALKLDQAEFARRVVAALPRIVRQDVDRNTADRIAQLLHVMHVDARVLPDDPQLAYIERAGASCGPLPRSSLGDFIQPGESYRLSGSTTRQPWPAPVDEKSAVPAVDPGDVDDSTPSASTGDEPVYDMPAAGVTYETSEPLADEPSASTDDEPEHATPASDEPDHSNDIAREEDATDAGTELPGTMLPPLPSLPAVQPSSIAEPSGDIDGIAPGLDATAPAHDDELFNPSPETPAPDAPDAADPVSTELTPAAAPRRSRAGRLVLLLVLVALAVWAYRYWTASTPAAAPPVAVGALQAFGADAGPSTPPARVVTGDDSTTTPRPASPASAAVAGSTPAPATTATAPATAGSTPRPAASTFAPSAAASTPAPTTTIQAPAPSASGMLPASTGTIMPAQPVR